MTLSNFSEVDIMDVRLWPLPEVKDEVVVCEDVSVAADSAAELVMVVSRTDDFTVVSVLPVIVSDGDSVMYDVENELLDFVTVVGVTVGIGDKCDEDELMPSPSASALTPLASAPSPPSTVLVEGALDIELNKDDVELLLPEYEVDIIVDVV